LNASILNDLWELLEQVKVVMLEKVILVATHDKLFALIYFSLSVVVDFVAVGQSNIFIVHQVNKIK